MVRCGIAIYGLDPFGADPYAQGLEPALALHSYVADVKRFDAGDSAGYGRSWRAPAPTRGRGAADRLRRRGPAGAVQQRGDPGRRAPLPARGTVSMDNVTIDVGAETDVEPGAPAVLIGAQGDERILAEELAARLGTINYEITCGISARVPREVVAAR